MSQASDELAQLQAMLTRLQQENQALATDKALLAADKKSLTADNLALESELKIICAENITLKDKLELALAQLNLNRAKRFGVQTEKRLKAPLMKQSSMPALHRPIIKKAVKRCPMN